MVDWKEHLKRAVRVKGSQNLLAEAMGCSQAKISWLLVSAESIKAEDAIAVERATAGEVLASDLRPDIWPSAAPLSPNPTPQACCESASS